MGFNRSSFLLIKRPLRLSSLIWRSSLIATATLQTLVANGMVRVAKDDIGVAGATAGFDTFGQVPLSKPFRHQPSCIRKADPDGRIFSRFMKRLGCLIQSSKGRSSHRGVGLGSIRLFGTGLIPRRLRRSCLVGTIGPVRLTSNQRGPSRSSLPSRIPRWREASVDRQGEDLPGDSFICVVSVGMFRSY